MLVANIRRGPEQVLILPVSDPRHEFNAEQISQAENRCALALCIGMNRVRLNLGLIFMQEVQNIVTFPRSACRKTAHEGDVVVRNQVVADAAIAAVADVVFGRQRLWIQIPLHAIGRSRLSESPEPLEWEFDVSINDGGYSLIQASFRNMSLI